MIARILFALALFTAGTTPGAAAPDSADARLAGFYIQRLLPEHAGLLAEARAEGNDLANADFVARTLRRADIIYTPP